MDPFEEEANKWQSKLRALKQAELKQKLNEAAIQKARILADQVSFYKEENDLLSGKIPSTEELAQDAQKNKLVNKQAALRAQYPNNPTCYCGCLMVERTNKNTGDKFWGCSNYPTCTATAKMPNAKRKRY